MDSIPLASEMSSSADFSSGDALPVLMSLPMRSSRFSHCARAACVM